MWKPKEQIVYKDKMCQTCYDHYPNNTLEEERIKVSMREETYPAYPEQEHPLCSSHAHGQRWSDYSNCAFCGYTKDIVTTVYYGGYHNQNICQECLQKILFIAEGL